MLPQRRDDGKIIPFAELLTTGGRQSELVKAETIKQMQVCQSIAMTGNYSRAVGNDYPDGYS